MARIVREWWPVPALLAATLLVQARVLADRSAVGHATGHLTSATTVFAASFAMAVLLWALPPALRRHPLLLVLAAAMWVTGLLETIANLRVVDAVGADDWTDAEAARLGPSRPGFESGHQLSEVAEWTLKGVSIVLALWLLRRGAVPQTLGRIAAFTAVIALPWVLPGIGAYLAVLGVVVQRARSRRSAREAGRRPASRTSAAAADALAPGAALP